MSKIIFENIEFVKGFSLILISFAKGFQLILISFAKGFRLMKKFPMSLAKGFFISICTIDTAKNIVKKIEIIDTATTFVSITKDIVSDVVTNKSTLITVFTATTTAYVVTQTKMSFLN